MLEETMATPGTASPPLAKDVPGAMPPGAAGPGSSSELWHPTAGGGHVCALCGTTAHRDGDNSLPAPAVTVPSAGDSWEGPKQQRGEAQDRLRPATTRARSCASAGPPRAPWGCPLHPGACSTPKPPVANRRPFTFPRGHPKRFRTWVLGGTPRYVRLHACWGDREQGGRLWCCSWPRREGRTVHACGIPHPAAEPGAGRGSRHVGVSVSQLKTMKTLSWR